jgi:prevent-host-death family protein
MTITTIPSRQFNQGIGKAKKAAKNNPVVITDRGRPSYVFLSIELYQKITGTEESILDLLAMPDVAEVDFQPHGLDNDIFKSVDFS